LILKNQGNFNETQYKVRYICRVVVDALPHKCDI